MVHHGAFTSVDRFAVCRLGLQWPWLSADGDLVAYPDGRSTVRVDRVAQRRVEVARLALPCGLSLPTERLPIDDSVAQPGLHAFAVDRRGRLAVTGLVEGRRVVATMDAAGRLLAVAGARELIAPGFAPRACRFGPDGVLWLSAEGEEARALGALEPTSLSLLGRLELEALPPPCAHELWVHPSSDVVALVGSCGQDGTWIDLARRTAAGVERVPHAMGPGAEPSGIAGVSADGATLFLARCTEVEARAWPTLERIGAIELEETFMGSYAGDVFGDLLLVFGEHVDDGRPRVVACEVDTMRVVGVHDLPGWGWFAAKVDERHVITIDGSSEPAEATSWRVDLEALRGG